LIIEEKRMFGNVFFVVFFFFFFFFFFLNHQFITQGAMADRGKYKVPT